MHEKDRIKTAEQVNRLEDWFGKKLKTEQFNTLVDNVAWIPAPAMAAIVDRIIEDNPPNPGRFPTVARIREGWETWKHENPQMVARKDRTPCDACQTTGFIWARRALDGFEDGIKYEYVFHCPDCKNWEIDCGSMSPIPFANFAKLDAMGFEVKDWQTAPHGYRPPKGGVKEIAKSVLKSAPEYAQNERRGLN